MTVNGLFERGLELEELDSQMGRAAAGEGGLVVVEGPAGIGKSRLLVEARRRAEGSMRVLSARGSELEREFSFGVVRQLFEVEVATPERRQALLGGAARPAAPVLGEIEATSAGSDDVASFAALHGLFWFTLNLAHERPLLLAIDDMHWCDRPSLLFVAYLCRRLERQPILLLAGVRAAEPVSDPVLLGEIAHDPAAARIAPRPLSGEGVAALIEERLGAVPDQAFAAACRDATGGNPLLLTQLATALHSEGLYPSAANAGVVAGIGPRAVSRSVLLRLARLPAAAAAVARAVAVLGDGAALPAVAKLAGVEEERAAEATRALADAAILGSEGPLAFVHPLVRDAVYHELPAGERDLGHARAAAILRGGGAPAEQVAAQLLHTSPRGERWAADLLWEAGRAAMRRGAADSAVSYLRRALDEPPPDAQRGRLLLELGAAELLTSGPAAAERLALAYEALGDQESRAIAAGMLSRALMYTGSAEEAAAVARRASRELPPELADLRMQLEAFAFMTTWVGAGDPKRLAGLRPYRQPPAGGPGAHMLAAVAAWEWLCTDGSAADCARLALEAVADGQLIAADNVFVSFAAIVTLVLTDRPEAVAVWERLLADAHGRGSLFAASSIHLWHGLSRLRRGELADAEESLRAAHEEATLWGYAEAATVHIGCFLTDVLLERGRLAEAADLFAQLPKPEPRMNSTGWWLGTCAALRSAEGRSDEAVAAADELARHCETVPDPGRLWWRSLKAEALHRIGPSAEALTLAREELEITRRFGAPSALGRTLRILGTLERDRGLGKLNEAVEVLEGSPARLEHAKALTALGSALRRARKPTDAREPLRRARELAALCGADGLAQRARSELHATGARPRRDALRGVDSLTPSERRVADLAAAGHTNREIAQELYVTPKTVELHLSNAYRKLDISSRHELGRALGA